MSKPFGRPLKTPELGPRVPVCVKLPEAVVARLRLLATQRSVSQSDILTELIMRQKPRNRP